MANKRMFSKDVVVGDKFLDLPFNSQLLYFHLGVNGDLRGFVEPKGVIRMIGLKIEDLKPLIEGGFVLLFESGVLVVTHWKVNNNLREDREAETRFINEFNSLTCINNEYSLREYSGNTPVKLPPRIGKYRIGKDRDTEVESKSNKHLKEEKKKQNALTILGWFNQAIGTNFKSTRGFEDNLEFWLEEYSEEDVKQAIVYIAQGKWWAKNPSPTLLFRKKTPKGEIADYIGSLLNGGVNNE